MLQASGRLPSTVMSKTTSRSRPIASRSGVPGSPGASAEDHQPVAVVAEAQLASRAQHPVRGDAAQFPAGDRLLGLREERADRRERHAVADIEVARAAHDLERLGTGVDDDQADPVGTLDRTNLEDSAHDDLAQALPHVLDALDDEPEIVERSPQHVEVVGKRGEITEPAEVVRARSLLGVRTAR